MSVQKIDFYLCPQTSVTKKNKLQTKTKIYKHTSSSWNYQFGAIVGCWKWLWYKYK